MIIHASARILERYQIRTADKLPPESAQHGKSILARDADDELFQWSMDLFKFMGKDCLAVMNHATKFSLFLFNVQPSQFDDIGNTIAHCILDMYSCDSEMTASFQRMLHFDRYVVFAPVRKRNMITQINHLFKEYARFGNLFLGYIDYKNTLHTRQINYDVNHNHTFTRKEGGVEISYQPGDYLRELVTARYGNGSDRK